MKEEQQEEADVDTQIEDINDEDEEALADDIVSEEDDDEDYNYM